MSNEQNEQPESTQPEQPAAETGRRRPFGGGKPSFMKKDRPPREAGKPPVVDHTDFFGGKPRLRDLDKQIEEDLAQAMAGLDNAALMPDPLPRDRTAKPTGEPVRKKGRVVSVRGKDVFIEVPGGRSQGVLPAMQFEDGPPAVGTEVEFDVERYDAANGLLILTRKGAAQSVDWSSVAVGMIVEARVTGTTRGGLSVEVNGIRGFMPISQIDLYRVEQPEQFINQRLRCRITEVDPADRNLVVSRRDLLERERMEQAEKFWAEVEVGQTREGYVRGLKPFGVFVDLGGADGLIPIHELGWARVSDPSEVVQLGQKVTVKVTNVNYELRKVGLSLKQLSVSPWDTITHRIYAGAFVTGKITRTTDYGAFVELEPGVEGLIHVSEIGIGRVRRVVDAVKVGQEVEAKVLSVDRDTQRISLSLKAAIVKANSKPAEASESSPEEEDAPTESATPRPRNPNLRGGVSNVVPSYRTVYESEE